MCMVKLEIEGGGLFTGDSKTPTYCTKVHWEGIQTQVCLITLNDVGDDMPCMSMLHCRWNSWDEKS